MSDTSNAFASMRTSAASLPAFGGNGNDSSADNSSTNNSTYGTPSSQAVYATAAAPSHLYPIPLVPDNYPSTYHVPSAESLQMYAQPEGNAGPLAADGYDAYSSQQYMSNGNGETTAAYYSYQNSSYESAASGFDPRHPVSYTQFPQHNRLLQHHAHYNYEDAGGVDSLARINAFHNGGYGAAGSPPYLQSHTENMPDACLTGYGTDQGSPSLKSMMSSREASAHGGGSAVCAASTDPRMSSSRSWFSANDCSANTSVQGSVSRSGCQPFMPGGHGGNYPNNGDTQLMAVVSPGNGLAEPQYVSSGHHDHSRSSLPAPAMGGCRYAGVERVAAAPHLFFSGGAHHSSSSNSSMATSPSGSPRKRYYNNPYCATSPKLYC
ncbi:hypothetical protein ABL78_8412 [Leptomonas seymouri]|uniref:Uncharacterized protein n=1 Tax=Leptomonas seymouri TaxID=5684 RepID=A0A0N1HY99_LEPSE|nr:hypothetical protein ABL78_8412 [Leptomonas seymouri]|eukprot:KPI82578.1 hypothetical protein ABL78_8412 [Leptomonas seymouri]